MANGYGTQISALRIIVTVREGRTAFRLAVVVAPAGGAKVVKEAAINNPTAAGATEPPKASNTTAGGGNAGNSVPAKKLNYPFTLLEIRENAEISAVLASPTKA